MRTEVLLMVVATRRRGINMGTLHMCMDISIPVIRNRKVTDTAIRGQYQLIAETKARVRARLGSFIAPHYTPSLNTHPHPLISHIILADTRSLVDFVSLRLIPLSTAVCTHMSYSDMSVQLYAVS